MTSGSDNLLTQYSLAGRVNEARDLLLDAELEQLFERVQTELTPPPADVTRLAELLERMAYRSGDPLKLRTLYASAWAARRQQNPPSGSADLATWLLSCYADATLGQQHLDLAMWAERQPLDRWLSAARESRWEDELSVRVAVAALRLARKAHGRSDIQAAEAEIGALRSENQQAATPVDAFTEERLVALYNLARILEVVAGFLDRQEPHNPADEVRRHARQLADALHGHPDARFARACRITAEAFETQLDLSIWSATADISKALDEHVRVLAEDPDEPIVELWPAQRTALRDGLAHAAARAVVIELPTSAGKTLLAEFAVIQARAAYPDRTAAYVVPTRALVNQVSRRLRRDLAYADIVVEAAVPVAEIDAAEEPLLRERIDVLVTTPEKLEILVRSNHQSVASLGLLIVDEAHLIRDFDRGPRLELLLATVRTERPQARFVLLTPFAEGGSQIAEWLGGIDGRAVGSSWRPTQRAVLIARTEPRTGSARQIEVETVDSGGRSDFTSRKRTRLGYLAHDAENGRAGITVELAVRAARRGGVLVLCSSRSAARTRAVSIHRRLPTASATPSELRAATIAFARLELGTESDLASLLDDGIAYHHRGLSPELRQLLELNAAERELRAITGTTTLAAGVNFPIATVIFDALRAGNQPLSHADFWNIAGRAGRARLDRVGLVVVACEDAEQERRAEAYLADPLGTGTSPLVAALRAPDLLTSPIDLGLVRRYPGIAVLLQYLAHAVRIARQLPGEESLRQILESTLVYRQLQTLDSVLAERMLEFSARYLAEIEDRGTLISRADGTGFSTPVAAQLRAIANNEHPEWRDGDWWDPSGLFGSDRRDLAGAIGALNNLPGLDLTTGMGGAFDPDWAAQVAVEWVGGRPIEEIAAEHFANESPRDRIAAAGSYIYGKLSGNLAWGLGALQRIVMNDDPSPETLGVPSLIYYGVRSRPAARLRMAGAFRPGAEALAQMVPHAADDVVQYRELRQALANLPAAAWRDALGADAAMSGEQAKTVAAALAGIR